MATVPSTHTVATGSATSSEMNTFFRDPINFLLAPPAAALRQSATTSLTTSVWGAIGFDTEDEDNVSGHDTVTNNSRYTAVYAGWYMCSGGINFAANATGQRGARWAVNGTAYNGGIGVLVPPNASGATAISATTQRLFLNVGDYVELQGFQSSGGGLNAGSSVMSILWAGNS